MIRLSQHVYVHLGSVCAGIVLDGDQALLIDDGDGSVEESLRELGVTTVDRVLFTHHHRDQASGVNLRVESGTRITVPATELPWFEDVESFWNDLKRRWHLYDDHPHPSVLAESIRIDAVVQGGDELDWGPAKIRVLDTPAHTDGSVTYVVDVDGQRIAFTGDLIAGEGKLWDVHSIQKKGETSTDYHGFMGARKALRESLERVLSAEPDVLVPSHGEPMSDPRRAVDALNANIDRCYDRYVAGSALRYYFGDMFRAFEGKPNHMAMRPVFDPPAFLRHIGTTWIVLSEAGEAFVMDCGSNHVVEHLDTMVLGGEITDVTGFWVTHYHDDHVDAIPSFQERFPCPTWADEHVAQVIEDPTAHRIPCVSPSRARVDHRTTDGNSWQWNEFTMTAYFFPGQTYYHGGLLVAGRGARLFFTGDSFTPSGMDDYCAANRNPLGEGIGYDRCLSVLDETKPTHLFNCHVGPAWNFGEEHIEFMRANLRERESLFTRLIDWEHPNFGLDPHWARCFPYEQSVRRGEWFTLRADFTNYAAEARVAGAQPVLPSSWNQDARPGSCALAAGSDGSIVFRLRVPENATTGRTVVPMDITFGGRRLGQIREAVLVIEP